MTSFHEELDRDYCLCLVCVLSDASQMKEEREKEEEEEEKLCSVNCIENSVNDE